MPDAVRDFRRSDKEIFRRAQWLSTVTVRDVLAAFMPGSASHLLDDDSYVEQDRRLIHEALGYSMSFVLDRLRDEITAAHGWTDDTYDLHLKYMVHIGLALDVILGLHVQGSGSSPCYDLLDQYYRPVYGKEYQVFWGVRDAAMEEFAQKTLAEVIHDCGKPPRSDWYSVEMFYTWRLSKIVHIANRDTVMNNARRLYAHAALNRYSSAFFGLSLYQLVAGSAP